MDQAKWQALLQLIWGLARPLFRLPGVACFIVQSFKTLP
jgi:hypothetical protein